MNKRVHQIAKEQGLAPKDVLARLKAGGLDVKAASSSVDEAAALRVLANGDGGAAVTDGSPATKQAPRDGGGAGDARSGDASSRGRGERGSAARGDARLAARGCAGRDAGDGPPQAAMRRQPAATVAPLAPRPSTSARLATRSRASVRPATRAAGAGS